MDITVHHLGSCVFEIDSGFESTYPYLLETMITWALWQVIVTQQGKVIFKLKMSVFDFFEKNQ